MRRDPTQAESKRVAQEVLLSSKDELEKRSVTWDLLSDKLVEELSACRIDSFKGEKLTYEQPTLQSGRRGKGKWIAQDEVIYSKPLVAWEIRQRARMDAHKLRGDYPAEKKEIGGIGGGPIRLLEVEFVKPDGI